MWDFFRAAANITDLASKVADAISEFNSEAEVSNYTSKTTETAISILFDVPGMTQAHSRDFKQATPIFALRDGSVVKKYENPAQFLHVFIGDPQEKMIFGGFGDVLPRHSASLTGAQESE